ncbi:MAG: HAD-IA family hydrolase [Clostridia bacterium]|nr:HAD-IA family hydrolase [Clostridia bacterium]
MERICLNGGAPLIIFDMDGTLIDSEGAIGMASLESLTEFGINPRPEDFLEFTGKGDDRFVGGVAEKYGLSYDPVMKERAYEIYMEHPERLSAFPWSKRVISTALERGFSVAIASASDRIKLEFNIRFLGFSPEVFSVILTALDVKSQKPDPEIFLLTAEKAGRKASECIVCEDSLSGVMAGKAAGMTVMAVTTGYTRQRLAEAGADHIFDDLSEMFRII